MFIQFFDGFCFAELTAAHYGNAVAYSEEFGQVATDDKYGFGCSAFGFFASGERVDKLVYLGFGSHVDSSRGFVEQENVNVGVQQSSDGNFLLVTAAEIADGLASRLAFYGDTLDPRFAGFGLLAWSDEPSGAKSV